VTLIQVAVFDTAFHQTMPAHAFMYALPYNVYKDKQVRKYGFHGTSYRYITEQAAHMLGKPESQVNLIACHIGRQVGVAFVAPESTLLSSCTSRATCSTSTPRPRHNQKAEPICDLSKRCVYRHLASHDVRLCRCWRKHMCHPEWQVH
jgi:Acetokinase family